MRRAALVCVTAAVALLPGVAEAHESDPRTATVVDAVQPALPAGVVVQARTGVAPQLVAENPTASLLEVLGPGGRPFLRLSRAGVFGDVESPDFYETGTPSLSPAAVPARVRRSGGRAPARWVQISRGDAWGWYDARLHPPGGAVPASARRPVRLGSFTVPMTYAGRPVRVRGHLELRPLLGGFAAEVAPPPPGLQVQLLQGRLPGVFLSLSGARSVTVLGEDGEPFLRLGRAGSAVNTASRTYVEDRAARGQPAPPAAATPRWQALPGSSYTWLDGRLRAPQDAPAWRHPVVVGRWRIPVVVDGQATALTGAVRWTPDPALSTAAAARPALPLLPLGLGGVGLLGLGVLAVRRVSR